MKTEETGSNGADKKFRQWGTELFVLIRQEIKDTVRKLKEAGKSQTVIAELEIHIQQLYQLEQDRVVKYAFRHTKAPPTPTKEEETAGVTKPWCHTLHLERTDSASQAREKLLFDLALVYKGAEFRIQADRAQAEGGKLAKQVRNLYELPLPKSVLRKQERKKEKKKRGAPATPQREKA